LREVSNGSLNLDDVVRELSQQYTTISLEKLRQAAENLAGESLSSLPSEGTSH